MDALEGMTINLEQRGGRPCSRNMRIRVILLLSIFAAGLGIEDFKSALRCSVRDAFHSRNPGGWIGF